MPALAEQLFNKVTIPVWSVISKPISNSASENILKVLGVLPEESKVLDVGIGTGVCAKLLASKSFIVEGVDASQDMLDTIPTSIRTFKGEATQLPVESGNYNALLYNYVFRYIDAEETDTVLEEASRVLKSDGLFIVTDFGFPRIRPGGLLDRKVLGIWSGMSRENFKGKMKEKGFEHQLTLFPLLSFMMVFKKIEEKVVEEEIVTEEYAGELI